MTPALQVIAESIRAGWSAPFRGEIFDYAAKLNLQDGYAVKGPLAIADLRHLLQPLQALRDPRVRLVSVIGAVQCTKSLLADVFVPYAVEHDPGDCLWLLEDDPKARLYADRALGLIRSVPEIAALLGDVDRTDKTKTRLRFRHMNLLIAGLNPGNVQSLTWRYLIIDETWLHPFDGLLRQAIDRTKQYPDTKKILLIGQGGLDGDDHDREHSLTDRRELHFACPSCRRYQPFELSRLRPEDLPAEKLRGTYAGLCWDTNELTKPGGRWDFDAVAKTAHHRCYFCDARIEDTPEVRRALNDSYVFFPAGTAEDRKEQFSQTAAARLQNADPAARSSLLARLNLDLFPFPERVGFHWPAEASMRLSFASQVIKYLRAKTEAEEQGYRLPLQEFYQKDRGIAWSETFEADYKAVSHEPYDVKSDWAEEAYRVLIADCQRDLKLFYYSVFAMSITGETRELARGQAIAFGDPKPSPADNAPDKELEAERTLAGVQRQWAIKDQHVFLDCGYEKTKTLKECVRHGHVASIKVAGKIRKIWRCWTGLEGSPQEVFKWINPRTKLVEYRIYSDRRFYNVNIGNTERAPRAPWYLFSALHCADLARARRDAESSAPKLLTLPDTLPPTDPKSYFAQTHSERRLEVYSAGKKRAQWVLVKQGRPNHEWDKLKMLMAFQAIVGIIGAGEDAPAEAPSAS